jgi:Ca-activated chloride channel family protein
MGFGFLVPAAFLAGAALLVAVAITYLLKPSRPARRVSSTLLWMAAYHELQARRPWRRIPPSVLLLLQILALAALVIALARPYVLSAEATGPDAIVLLDVSASMQASDVAPSRFEAARARVAGLIDALEVDQTLGLISLGAEPRLVAPRTNDRDLLFRALAGMQPTTQTANLPAALSLAASLADGRPETIVFVVGDGATDRSQIPADLPFAVRYIAAGGPAENLAIGAFGTRTVDGRLAVLGRVTNHGAERHTATLDLRVDGTRFDARFLAIEPGASADATWDELPSTARVLEARLLETDALALDNLAWAVVGGDRPTRILLVTEANIFVERALALRPNAQIVRADPSTYSPEALRGQAFDLIVFDGFLPPVLPDSGSLFLIHPPQGTSLLRTREDVLVSRMAVANTEHPLLADVPLAGVNVSRSRRLDVPTWADVVLESPETPLLLVGEEAGHRVAVLGFDVHQSDLPVQPAFPILMQHLLDWLVPPGSVATPVIRVGDAASVVPLPEAQSVEIATPDSRRVRVAPPFPVAPFADTLLPGIYQVVQRDANGQATESLFAANFVSPAESRLVVDHPPAVLAAGSGVQRSGAPAAPREIWQWAAVLAVGLLAAEWWAYHRQ